MTEPIKNKRLNDLAGAPTPQNTPATASSSYIHKAGEGIPSVATINEEENGVINAHKLELLNMVQGKLHSLIGAPSQYLESLPTVVKNRINGLKAIQEDYEKLESKFQQELLELEKKYFNLYKPLYAKRADIISGKLEPTPEEIEAGKKITESQEWDGGDDEEKPKLEEISEEDGEEEKKTEKKEDEEKDIKGIPNFWLTALRNIPEITELITDRDAEAISHLIDIRMKFLEKPGFALEFEFEDNDFFDNKVLTKTYYYQDEPGYGGDFIYDHATGDEIHWKSSDKNLTVKIEKRKQRNKHTNATRTVEKTIPVDSFFHFFTPPTPPTDESEADDELETKLELDYQIGEIIKEKLIPRAIDWFTGEALRYEDFGDDEDYEDEYEEDDEDDEYDEEAGDNEAPKEECKQS